MLLTVLFAMTMLQTTTAPLVRPASEIEATPSTIEDAAARQEALALRLEEAKPASHLDGAPSATKDGGKTRVAARERRNDDDEPADWLAPFKYYYPLELDDDLEPETQSNMILIWILTAIAPYGGYWSPYLFEEPGDGLLADVLLSGLAHSFVVSLPMILFVIPVIGWIVGYVLLVGLALATSYYLMPVAVINLYDRSLKRKKAGLGHPLDLDQNPLPSGEKKRKRRGGDKIEDDGEFGGEAKGPHRVPEVAYAY